MICSVLAQRLFNEDIEIQEPTKALTGAKNRKATGLDEVDAEL